MNIGNRNILSVLLIAALTLAIFNGVRPVASSGTLYASPVTPGMATGSTFSAKIQVANIDPFNAWDISVQTDNTVIRPQSLTITPNILTANYSLLVGELINCVNGAGTGCISTDGPGIAHSAVAGFGPPPQTGPSSGLLFTITYKVIGPGSCTIHLFNDVIISGSTGAAIAHTTVDGSCGPIPTVHALSVTAVTPSGSTTIGGSLVTITVAVANTGNQLESSVTVIAFADGVAISPTATISSLAAGVSTGASITWTTPAPATATSYTISAKAADAATTSNTFTDGTVTVNPAVHALSVAAVTPSTNTTGGGNVVTITVAVANTGNQLESGITVTAFVNGGAISPTATISSLAVGASTMAPIPWTTPTVAASTVYTISAKAADASTTSNAFTDGTVTVNPAVHALSVTAVTSGSNIVGGSPIMITVGLANTGNEVESNILVTAFANGVAIAPKATIATLSPGTSAVASILWYTPTVVASTFYTISAKAADASTTSNAFTDGTVTVNPVPPPGSGPSTLYYLPQNQAALPVGSTFGIKVQVANIDPFNAWDISVLTDPTVISPQSLTITPNMLTANYSVTMSELINCVNGVGAGCIATDGAGIVHSAAAEIVPPICATQTGPSSGLLFTITYKVITSGFSQIHIFNNIIANGCLASPVPTATTNGFYSAAVHALSVTAVTSSATSVSQGTVVTIGVAIKNTGNQLETSITVTALANGVTAGTATIASLAAGASATALVTWDTTIFAPETYTISAKAADSNTTSTTFTDGTVIVTPPVVTDCHFVHGKLSWTHHLSLAKNPAGQTFTAHVRCDNTPAEFVQISVIGSSSAEMFTATSAATSIPTAGVVTDVTFSQSVLSNFIGTKICFTASVHWGPTAATVMANLSPVTKSGCFVVLP